jgi:glucose/arabinose dehydrogenase
MLTRPHPSQSIMTERLSRIANATARSTALAVSGALCLAGATGAAAAEESVRIEVPSVQSLNIDDAAVETVIDGLSQPWAFEFIGPDEVLLTEIRGRMLRIDLTSGEKTALAGLPPIATDREQTGLLDVALFPDFETSRRIAFSYVQADDTGDYFATVVDSAVLGDDRLTDRTPLVPAQRHTWSPSNFGGALAFGPDGHLFVAMGDRSDLDGSQNGRLLSGKVLRLNHDGTAPKDNPFVDDPAVDDRVWALGVRNPQGLDFDAERGVLFEAEHGPNGGDEVNVIVGGRNYGWPVISYGRHYTTGDFGMQEGDSNALVDFHLATARPDGRTLTTHRTGLEQPLFYFTPSIAASPLVVVRGSMFPEWRGHVLVGALKGKHVSKIDVDGRGGTLHPRSEVEILGELSDRVRDLRIGPDGAIWILTQNTGLHRLFRDPQRVVAAGESRSPGQSTYEVVCSGCHIAGSGGAQKMTDPSQWQDVLERPREEIYRRVIEGYRGMPERGTCYRCSDELLQQTVDWMLEQVAAESRGVAPED